MVNQRQTVGNQRLRDQGARSLDPVTPLPLRNPYRAAVAHDLCTVTLTYTAVGVEFWATPTQRIYDKFPGLYRPGEAYPGQMVMNHLTAQNLIPGDPRNIRRTGQVATASSGSGGVAAPMVSPASLNAADAELEGPAFEARLRSVIDALTPARIAGRVRSHPVMASNRWPNLGAAWVSATPEERLAMVASKKQTSKFSEEVTTKMLERLNNVQTFLGEHIPVVNRASSAQNGPQIEALSAPRSPDRPRTRSSGASSGPSV